jgi:hypothetical protein
MASVTGGEHLGALVRERLTELIAQDLAEAVREWRPGPLPAESTPLTPYERFLAQAASEIWEELQE